MVFDQIKFGLHYSDAAGVIDFNQYGFSFSTLSTIFEDFFNVRVSNEIQKC